MYFLKKTRDIAFKSVSKQAHWVYASDFIQQLAFFALAFVIFYIGHSSEWTVFSERDISRAIGWLKGHFYWPGPEMSGGNNLPGPFFYFLLFPAILMGEDTYSQVALWSIIWLALTYTVAFAFIQKIISHRETLLICLITFISSRNIHNYSMLLNPEFAILFHVLAVIGLYYWREKRNSLYLYLTGLVIALGIQTHLLVALHTITVLLFYIIDKSERKKIKTLLLFLLLALSPILIYNILKYFHVFETSGRQYSDYINWLLKNIFSERWVNNIKELMFFV
ncbi:MAG: glycosyltransferase family 39 protein, partial [Oligoflexia bacterium]|nr:glycosyltransferase family 39 protein [Oligoflexia bacterium]